MSLLTEQGKAKTLSPEDFSKRFAYSGLGERVMSKVNGVKEPCLKISFGTAVEVWAYVGYDYEHPETRPHYRRLTNPVIYR